VASRGTEIFTVVGNKIRWADLARVKDQWEDSSHRGPSYSGAGDGLGDENSLPYRVCFVPGWPISSQDTDDFRAL